MIEEFDIKHRNKSDPTTIRRRSELDVWIRPAKHTLEGFAFNVNEAFSRRGRPPHLTDNGCVSQFCLWQEHKVWHCIEHGGKVLFVERERDREKAHGPLSSLATTGNWWFPDAEMRADFGRATCEARQPRLAKGAAIEGFLGIGVKRTLVTS